MPSTEVVSLSGLAFGGEAVGRLADGCAVFVAFAIPGETVRVEVTQRRRSWARARLVEIIEPSPDRVEPPCPYFGPGRCGGCRLQHVSGERQAAMARQIVTETLQRLGRIGDPPVADTVRPAGYGYRSRARFAVDDQGRLAYRRAGSHDLLAVDRCLLLTDAAQALRDAAGDQWRGADEVEVRSAGPAGALVIRADGDPPPLPPGDVPVALRRAGGRPRALRGDPLRHQRGGGVDVLVSPASFFQANRAGGEILLALVRAAAAVAPGDTAIDLFCGVGLFARGLAADGADVTAVEGSAAAVADAERNLAGLAQVVRAPAGEAVAALREAGRTVDVVVLNPPRKGAGATLTTDLAAVATRTIVYVACDPAALARDARTLGDAGWALTEAVPVDQFAQTGQIEVVATFRPAG